MGIKALKQRILSLEKRIAEHSEKILNEMSKDNPDNKLIAHWEKEIRAFTKSIEIARKRLRGDR